MGAELEIQLLQPLQWSDEVEGLDAIQIAERNEHVQIEFVPVVTGALAVEEDGADPVLENRLDFKDLDGATGGTKRAEEKIEGFRLCWNLVSLGIERRKFAMLAILRIHSVFVSVNMVSTPIVGQWGYMG